MNLKVDDLINVRLLENHNSGCGFNDINLTIPSDLLNEYYCSEDQINIKVKWENKEYCLNLDSMSKMQKLDLVSCLRTFRMFTDAPITSRLPFPYQWIPQIIRILLARIIWKRNRSNKHLRAKFPSFPLDLSVDILSDIFSINHSKLSPTPVLLTHDIDNLESFDNLGLFLKEEEGVGAKSTNFIVPFKWKLNHNMLSDVRGRGHEIGIHGFDHNNRTPFLGEPEINRRLSKIRPLIEKYDIVGYRSPSLLRTNKLLNVLSKFFKYDSSVPTSGWPFPSQDNGCATARIFEFEGIHEIPLSMPRDAGLLFLGYKPNEILDLWIKCAQIISESGGVIVLLTHCDKCYSGNSTMLSVYRELLQYLKSDDRFTFKTCKELL